MFDKNDTDFGYTDLYDFFKTQLRKVISGEINDYDFLDSLCDELIFYEETLRLYNHDKSNIYAKIIENYDRGIS